MQLTLRHLHRPVDEGVMGEIVDKVEKEKQKQAKLEEIALKKNELRQIDEQERIKEVSSEILTSQRESESVVSQPMDVDEQKPGSAEVSSDSTASEPMIQEEADSSVTSTTQSGTDLKVTCHQCNSL